MTRLIVLAAIVVFVAGFAFLTVSAISEQGFNPLSALSILIVVVLGVGVVGALRNPPE
jgi:hypothetical protein